MYETIKSICDLFTITPFDALMAFIVFPLIFVAIWKLLEKVLFGPYIELFEAREAATSGAGATSTDQIQRAEKLEKQYEEELIQIRANAMSAKFATVQEATGKAAQTIGAAEDEAHRQQQEAREASARSLEDLREQAFRGADELVEGIVSVLKQPPAAVRSADNEKGTVQ